MWIKRNRLLSAKCLSLYAENNSRLEDISNFLAQQGIISQKRKKSETRQNFFYLLSNPFYIGLFRYAGEIYEGKHQPVISKKIFDKVQEVLKQRGRPHHKAKERTASILRTSEMRNLRNDDNRRIQDQKTEKRKRTSLRLLPLHEKIKNRKMQRTVLSAKKILDKQISILLQKFSLKKDWAEQLITNAGKRQKRNRPIFISLL